MARPNQESIDTFMNITGLPEAVAVQKLEEHGGDLNEAVNAHFNDGDRNVVREAPVTASQDDLMDIDDPVQTAERGPPRSFLSAARAMNQFSLLDPSFGRSLFDGGSDLTTRAPVITHPREVREIPIEFKDSTEASGISGRAPTIEDVTETEHVHGPNIHGTVIIEDEGDEDIPADRIAQDRQWAEQRQAVLGTRPQNSSLVPSAPSFGTLPDYNNEIEEEMVQAAIEASKWDVEGLRDPGPVHRRSPLEDPELAHAVSLSLKTAEQEKALREHEQKFGASEVGASEPAKLELGEIEASNGRLEAINSSFQDETEDVEELPLIRHRARRSAGSAEPTDSEEIEVVDAGPPLSPGRQNIISPRNNGDAFASEEWGGISSEEHDEAVMLEAAMFGGIPESGYSFAYTPHQFLRAEGSYPRGIPRPPSPSLAAQRLIREQQDDEYLASLQADREKEMKAMEEAEARRLEEQAAREAALEEERQKEEESRRKMEEEEELERQLAAKESSLPREPASDEENAVTLLVRMPDGSRRGRRFLKSDKLQSLFDFIDIGRGVKPGTYRVVRPYPRQAFSDGESALTLSELGLTSKQEALFLELI